MVISDHGRILILGYIEQILSKLSALSVLFCTLANPHFNPESLLGQEQDFRVSLCQDLCYIERVYGFIYERKIVQITPMRNKIFSFVLMDFLG